MSGVTIISFLKTQPVEYACLIDAEFVRVSHFEPCPGRFNRRAVDRNEREEIIICKSTSKLKKMIDANSQLVKMMKMQPESNLGGKECRLQKETINTGPINIIQATFSAI